MRFVIADCLYCCCCCYLLLLLFLSTSCNKFFVQICQCNLQPISCNKLDRLVATCHWQICYNLLKTHLRITSFDSKLATRLLTAYSRLVVKKLSHAKQTHPDIGLLIASLLQDVKKRVATWAFMAVYPNIHTVKFSSNTKRSLVNNSPPSSLDRRVTVHESNFFKVFTNTVVISVYNVDDSVITSRHVLFTRSSLISFAFTFFFR